MTGNYPQRSREFGTWNRTASSGFHFGNAVDDRINNPHRTVGEVLQDAGYRTAFFGNDDAFLLSVSSDYQAEETWDDFSPRDDLDG